MLTELGLLGTTIAGAIGTWYFWNEHDLGQEALSHERTLRTQQEICLEKLEGIILNTDIRIRGSLSHYGAASFKVKQLLEDRIILEGVQEFCDHDFSLGKKCLRCGKEKGND